MPSTGNTAATGAFQLVVGDGQPRAFPAEVYAPVHEASMDGEILERTNTLNDDTHNLTRNSIVSLREVTAETVRKICYLDVREDQRHCVAPNSHSIAQAYFEPHAWFRAIYADETPVGFLMIYDNAEEAEYFLWRFMIDARYQKMGFGKRAMDLILAHVRTRPNAHELKLSCHPGEDGPEGFYRKYGFSLTGEWLGNEAVMRIDL
jgi:diamine N-acetyltransferase